MRVGVITGGTSAEREISIKTGIEMMKNLDKNKYKAIEIQINNRRDLIDKLLKENIDFALIALHGKFGEDGEAQEILESLNIPYSGSGILASSLCMDKDISKRLMKAEGIPTPEWIAIKKHQELNYELINRIGYPVVVKPVNGGSSLGTYIVKNSDDIVDAVLKAFSYDEEIIIEKYIRGREITCSILSGKLLPIIEIKPYSEFFDYRAKYDDKASEEIVIELDEELKCKVGNICRKCWSLFKCSVYGRIDMIIKDNEPYVLEVNTLPGMTKNSLLPKSAKSYGLSFTELLNSIIELSLKINR
ncbi:D-alanine--D-alanine ligase [Clostridium swellfunianum]|uniref:D-alanine--D-alanine ligase n=1 Tax=Clostridium swellfunianum TaxID=1367462 RepID=UPI0020300B98|nr:D-alanine--D-alanine ligase [Clostridium swellfunianum]MCM0647987.1 D-alanine--D-alanine ligase [Clostridium swellfunianum]